jgi:hypothetical protein
MVSFLGIGLLALGRPGYAASFPGHLPDFTVFLSDSKAGGMVCISGTTAHPVKQAGLLGVRVTLRKDSGEELLLFPDVNDASGEYHLCVDLAADAEESATPAIPVSPEGRVKITVVEQYGTYRTSGSTSVRRGAAEPR